ncbi:putative ABC transport system permease protein [Haloactinopolyspora alba]|uniref:Putative ABC transport system permease protein n=1 Tax=Haloactinopolyspora alba TaxID=648780 RepID=A0A2P8DYZ4_9ACTN|nr:FtsX-like permease family protein [Haloactinopolyspora alba]PSL02442.1 putative ABC transport system permease protein [Haloactinopolyspora alba]
MLSVTLAGLRAYVVRFLLTGTVIVLSIGFTAGTLVLTDSLDRAGRAEITASAAGTDLAAVPPDDGADYLPVSLLDRISALDGVEAAAGHRVVHARLVGGQGRVPDRSPVRVLATPRDAELAALPLTDGRAPAAAGEIVLDTRTAERQRVGVGDAYTVTGADGRQMEFSVVGLAEPSVNARDHPEVRATGGDVQRLAARPGIERVDLRLEAGAAPADVTAAVRELGGDPGHVVLTGAELRERLVESSTSVAKELRIPLLMLGAVALIVAAFVVANTFRILVAQRTRELALLRTVGATRRQVLSGVLVESTAVGAVASLVGVAVGVLAAIPVGAVVSDDARDVPTIVSTATVLWSVAVGVAVTVGSALLPARAATRVAPLAAVRSVPDGADGQRAGRVRIAAGLVAIAAGSAVMAAGALTAGMYGLGVVVLGAAVCFLGVLVLGPRVVPPMVRSLGRLLAGRSGSRRATTRLATANAVRNPRRAAATSAALLIGVTMVAGFVTVAESTRASAGMVLDQQVPADFLVRSDAETGVPASAVRAVDALPETGPSVRLYDGTVTAGGVGTVDLLGIDLDRFEAIARVNGEGSVDDVAAGAVAIDRVTAERSGLGVGDDVTVEADSGTRTFDVGYVVDEGSVPFEGLAVTPDVFQELLPSVDRPARVGFDTASDVDTERARAAVVEAVNGLPGVSVTTYTDTREQLSEQLDQTLLVVLSILGLAVVIAVIGIANTMSLSVHERAREIGLLRALGQTQRQTRAMLSIEALLLSGVAALLGAVIGVSFAWAAVLSVEDLVFVVPWAQVAGCGVVAGALGLLASVVPGRRAARTAPVVALATE